MRPPPPPVPGAVRVGSSKGVAAEPADDEQPARKQRNKDFYDSDEENKPMVNLHLIFSGPEPEKHIHNIKPGTLEPINDDHAVVTLEPSALECHNATMMKTVQLALDMKNFHS